MALYYPLTRSEFKLFLAIIERGSLAANRDHDVFDINSGQYHLVKAWNGDYTVNHVRFGWWASKKINKAIKRNLLRANILTKTGQVLYGSNK